MASLTFYGGVGEIGGNIVYLEDEGTSIFLDFGKNFKKERTYFDEPYLEPREEKHLLALGILPEIQGIYKRDPRDYKVDTVLLTHAHADHMDYIRYLKDTIPIHCSEVTRDIVLAREWSSRSRSKGYEIAGLTSAEERIPKIFHILKTKEPTKIGNLEVEQIPVDHSVPGASGFIIHTSKGAVVYSGDFRRHGRRGAETEEFIQRSYDASPVALIIEGTNIVNARLSTEAEVEEKLKEVVSAALKPKLVMAGFSNVDADRITTFYQVAKSVGRKLALSMKQAFLVNKLRDAYSFNLQDPHIVVFQREKKTTYEWEKRVAETGCSIVTNKDIRNSQSEVILVASFYDMNEVAEIAPEPGSIYILSQSEPFNEEMEIDFNKLLGWLEHYGVPLYNIHTSGHASPQELKQTIEQIGAKKTFLIHTERPELYKHYLADLSTTEIICPEVANPYLL